MTFLLSRYRLFFLFVFSLAYLPFSFSLHSSTPYSLVSQAGASKTAAKAAAPVIMLDPGHGGSDEGAKVRQLQEKRIALLTTLYAKRYLEEMGYRVLLTRSKDTYVSLPKRVSLANTAKTKVFISVHFNSAKNTLAEGVEIFYYKEKNQDRANASKKLASCLLQEVLGQTEAVSRGVKSGNFHVIRETDMPSVILEAGFMTNYTEWSSLRKKSYLEKIAKGIALGVDQYIKS